ncbi:MAG TPA: flagellar protein export ATPase FliI [bacterium]|nr:flagellar protein export ATPase FliI [bacterium]HPP87508.1 flagellar protein export ATPase FliI [bacterium]
MTAQTTTSTLSAKFEKTLRSKTLIKKSGRVENIIGLLIEAAGPACNVGELCHIKLKNSAEPILAEVVGFKNNRTLLMPIGDITGIGPGAEVIATGGPLQVELSDELLGRILNGIGIPTDGKAPIKSKEKRSIYSFAPNALTRKRISEPLSVGIAAIDGLMTIGKGQRIGIFSGSGVGKSTLLGMIARYTSADVNVIALIGERGREVREFIEKELGAEGLKKSVVIIATSDQPAIMRLRGAFVAHTIAEYFRDQGLNVMLMMDSVTRFALAQRQVGLTIGEPPAQRGYTPSVFAILPTLLERSGTSENGSITGLYTILVDGDDMNEPIADNVRGILDGHIVLSRELAHRNHYPAIDVLQSISRVMVDIIDKDHWDAAGKCKETVATFRSAEDLININAYVKGTNPKIDYAINMIDKINLFLRQRIDEKRDYNQTLNTLKSLFKK